MKPRIRVENGLVRVWVDSDEYGLRFTSNVSNDVVRHFVNRILNDKGFRRQMNRQKHDALAVIRVEEPMKICVWPNGVWCEPEDLEGYPGWMSDDFETIEVEHWAEDGEPILPARFKPYDWNNK